VTHIRKDGREIPLLISSTMVRNDHGQPFFFSETAIDISEIKTLEEQLQIRQRMDSLGTLAAGIAHDFNNLLSGITGYLDLLHLRSDNFTSKQKRYLNQLTASVQRAADLVHQFQKLSHGNVSKKRYLDISQIVGEVFGFLQKTTDPLIQKQNKIESGRFYVKGNLTELSQVFLNLGVNAKEAIEAKGATRGDSIRAEARNVMISETKDKAMKGGRYVHLTFQDSGCGMSESIKAKAFDPLFSSKKLGQRKGQGLGLAMVYNIIKNHSGHITVDSTPGEGTVFHVYLPAAAPVDMDLEDLSDLMTGTETILLVDDEYMLRSVIKEELEQLGYSVITAADGKEALDIYQSRMKEISLVLLDLILQKIPGEVLIKKIVGLNPKANIIIASAQSENQVATETRSLVKGFLAKPLVLKKLSATLRRILDSSW
jgi:two-component system cell cycle sensor histidine kinase/response regulator CckA